jgi:hypothetical protein
VINHLADVHTTGVNWQSVGTIIGGVLGGLGAILTALARWINSRVAEHRDATTGQIKVIAEALGSRLDRVDSSVNDVSLRVARLEGPIQRTAATVQQQGSSGTG